jgi:flagellar biosynthesis/type III secretory pathway protein FliH
VSEEIQAWFKEYQEHQQRLQAEAHNKGRIEGLDEGQKKGERTLLLRLLRARFGELPAAAVARIQAAEVAELERWGERVLSAQMLAEVLDELS